MKFSNCLRHVCICVAFHSVCAQALVEHRRRLMTDFQDYRRRVEDEMYEAAEAYRREVRGKSCGSLLSTRLVCVLVQLI